MKKSRVSWRVPAVALLLSFGSAQAHMPYLLAIYDGNARYSDTKIVTEVVADSAGQFAIKPVKPGVYLALTRYRPAPAANSERGVSYTYSVVFEVTD